MTQRTWSADRCGWGEAGIGSLILTCLCLALDVLSVPGDEARLLRLVGVGHVFLVIDKGLYVRFLLL